MKSPGSYAQLDSTDCVIVAEIVDALKAYDLVIVHEGEDNPKNAEGYPHFACFLFEANRLGLRINILKRHQFLLSLFQFLLSLHNIICKLFDFLLCISHIKN